MSIMLTRPSLVPTAPMDAEVGRFGMRMLTAVVVVREKGGGKVGAGVGKGRVDEERRKKKGKKGKN